VALAHVGIPEAGPGRSLLALRPLPDLLLIHQPVGCEKLLALVLERSEERRVDADTVRLGEVLDDPLRRSIELARHDDHGVIAVQGLRQLGIESLAERIPERTAKLRHRVFVDLPGRQRGHPARVVEDLCNHVPRRPVSLELDDREIAFTVHRQNVDTAVEVRDDLPPDHQDVQADDPRIVGDPGLEHLLGSDAAAGDWDEVGACDLEESRHWRIPIGPLYAGLGDR
jgi:hypothetical protein